MTKDEVVEWIRGEANDKDEMAVAFANSKDFHHAYALSKRAEGLREAADMLENANIIVTEEIVK